MHPYGIVIPNKYEDIIQPLLESIKVLIPTPMPEILVIANEHDRDYGFSKIPYPDDFFVFARSANIGINHLVGKDVILVNDDISLMNFDFFNRLSEIAYFSDRIGILSPLIMGCVGQRLQRWHGQGEVWRRNHRIQDVPINEPLCFPCVFLKRKMLDQVGFLDESFKAYGGEDVEMCSRVRSAGWRTSVSRDLVVQHGDGSDLLGPGRGKSWSLSYARRDKY